MVFNFKENQDYALVAVVKLFDGRIFCLEFCEIVRLFNGSLEFEFNLFNVECIDIFRGELI